VIGGPRICYSCSGCDLTFDWDTDEPSAALEIKTIGSRYCEGCVDKEAQANGVPIEQVQIWRSRRRARTAAKRGAL
jgi:hypothetical protein